MVKNMNGKSRLPEKKIARTRPKKFMTPARLQTMLLKYPAIPIFTQRDIRRFLSLTPRQVIRALHQAIDEGVLIRIKPGLYCLAVRPPSSFIAANYLLDPSYVSLESALSYHRIIPENVYTITSVTPKPSKKINRLNREFSYHKINRQLYFGYSNVLIGGTSVLMAEKEKAVLDYIYFVVQGLRKINQRSNFSKLDKERLKTYAFTFKNVLKGRKSVAFSNLLRSLKLI